MVLSIELHRVDQKKDCILLPQNTADCSVEKKVKLVPRGASYSYVHSGYYPSVLMRMEVD